MLLGVAACNPDSLTKNSRVDDSHQANTLIKVTCTGSVQSAAVACQVPTLVPSLSPRTNRLVASGNGTGIKPTILGGQNVNVRLTSSNVSYDTGTEIFQFDLTVQNLLNEALGAIDGVTPDTGGIKVFFSLPPTAVTGSGAITVANADGIGTFTASNQEYYKYSEILAKNAVSAPKTWQFSIPSTVATFNFTVYIQTTAQALLVINEMLVNPGGTISDANGEWIELYNAGSLDLDLQNFFFSDSSAAGRRPYWAPLSSVVVPAGGYAVIGNTTNTTNNGGVPVDYAYGVFMAFANSLDAFKISYVVGTDTLTIDRTQYASAAVSAQNGISRELKNPALDNSNLDGSNWADALVTAVYGPGGRGTPKAQNSRFEP